MIMSLETKLIIFDLGGVVVPERGHLVKKEIAEQLEITVKELNQISREPFEKATRGLSNLNGFYLEIVRKLEKDINPEELLKTHLRLYKELHSDVNPNILDLIERLKKNKYMVVCLSNTEEEIAKYNRERGLFKPFHKAYLSYGMKGLKKPDPDIYLEVLKDNDSIEPPQVLFIDDRQKYVNGAEKLGIKSILYQNIHQLQFQLVKAKINCS